MFRSRNFKILFPAYVLVLSLFFGSALWFNSAVETAVESLPITRSNIVIIDAGHGGVDGGATSCTGIRESQLNLQIAVRVNDLLKLLGIKTIMIRTEDVSIYTEGKSIAQKKVSDLKNRVNIVNTTKDGILLSIHMNHFSDSRYYGPQVFYSDNAVSCSFAETMQTAIRNYLESNSNRTIKKATGVYLMQHINRPGILIECGFISNPEEESKLRDSAYQLKMSAVIATVTASFLSNT